MFKRHVWLNNFFVVFLVVLFFQNCGRLTQDSNSEFGQVDSASEYVPPHHPGEDHDVPTQEKMAIEPSEMLMDRNMIYAMFVDIFGPESANLAAIKKLKTEKAILGGSCSVYENFKSARNNFNTDAEAENCANSDSTSNLSAPVNSTGNVLQAALLNDACNAVIDNAKSIEYVYKQINSDQSAVVPPNLSVNITKLLSLFYRSKPMFGAGLMDSMKNVIGDPATSEGWKQAVSVTCLSNHWMVL